MSNAIIYPDEKIGHMVSRLLSSPQKGRKVMLDNWLSVNMEICLVRANYFILILGSTFGENII